MVVRFWLEWDGMRMGMKGKVVLMLVSCLTGVIFLDGASDWLGPRAYDMKHKSTNETGFHDGRKGAWL